MLSVANQPIMLSVIMLNVVMLSVVAPELHLRIVLPDRYIYEQTVYKLQIVIQCDHLFRPYSE